MTNKVIYRIGSRDTGVDLVTVNNPHFLPQIGHEVVFPDQVLIYKVSSIYWDFTGPDIKNPTIIIYCSTTLEYNKDKE